MIRPAHFGFNAETAANNSFQKLLPGFSEEEVALRAIDEFDNMVKVLRRAGIDVEVVQDTSLPVKPDAVFPNNWFSTHSDGTIVSYPVFSPLRRAERREDILSSLERRHQFKKRFCLEIFETDEMFLEGTGSMVLDRQNRVAYACLSPRTDVQVLNKFCLLMKYEACFFTARDEKGNLIYHTNVMMSLGTKYVVCCMDAVEAPGRDLLYDCFNRTGKELINISFSQMNAFAGNMIELSTQTGKSVWVMSKTAYESLDESQISKLSADSSFCVVSIPTIEAIGGGSARCMIAENFLTPLAL